MPMKELLPETQLFKPVTQVKTLSSVKNIEVVEEIK